MALADVVAASTVFPLTTVQTPMGNLPLRTVMVAIAGAEDGFGNNPGDKIGGGIPYSQWNCNRYTSFGPWQIHLPPHNALVTKLSGLSSPCAMAQWLADYHNNAVAAMWIVGAQGTGLGAWITYVDGKWEKYLGTAQAVSANNTAVVIPTHTTTVQSGVSGDVVPFWRRS